MAEWHRTHGGGIDPRLLDILAEARTRTGLPFEISSGIRTPEEQRKLLEQGYSTTMRSYHLPQQGTSLAAAADLYLGGDFKSDEEILNAYRPIAEAAKQIAAEKGYDNFTWGGDWKSFFDPYHFQLGGKSNPAMSLSTKDAAMAPTMTPTAKQEEPQSLWDRLTGRSEATGLNPLEAFAAGLDALILPEMRMGDVIRQQGAQRAKTAKEETQRNKSIEFLKRRADAGDTLASKYLDIVSTGVLPVGTGLASYLEQSTKVQKTSEAEQQINRLMETGMDRNTAIAVRDGRIKLSRHPVTQQVELIDMATGSRIGGLTEGAASAVSEAISTSTSNQPSTFENLPVEKAGGLIGWGASIANMVTDAVGAGQAFPEVGKAQSAMENLSKRTILMLEADFAGKPTNFTREIVESMTVKPAEVLKGEEGSYLKTTQMVKMLEDAVSGARTALANPEKHSPEKIRAAEQSVTQLQSLLDDYMSLKNAFEKKGIASQTPTSKGSTVIQDPEVKALIDMYTNPNYYRDNMLPSPN